MSGWKWVPVDATRQMIDAAQRVEEDGYDAMHKAMLEAAPLPPFVVGEVEAWCADDIDDPSSSVDVVRYSDYAAAVTALSQQLAAVTAERDQLRVLPELFIAAIKKEDDEAVDKDDYMLDSEDCIEIIRKVTAQQVIKDA